ncbi:MAG: class I adenylate-forming enzyme family protein [Planctomycetia bacterium]|jgi:acyl-coenzyme A synthetase/AMP-(fatty) acid ligase
MTSATNSTIENLADAPAEDRLASAIGIVARQFRDRTAIVAQAGGDARRVIDYATLAQAIAKLEAELDAARPLGIVARAKRVESLVVIAAACGRQHVPVAFLAEDARDLVGELHDWVTIDDSLALPAASPSQPRREFESVPTQVVVATSGTSGPPKLVEHSWDSLLAAARLAEQWHGLGWLLVYDATRWAGLQVWLQAVLTAGRVVVPASRDPDVVAKSIAEEQVSILPATPTLLRRLITSADRAALAGLTIDRITLGGEAADAQLLEQAKELFPGAKITHVYATTELGEVFRVTDGKAGFPAEWLSKPLPGGVRISMRRDGELLVQLSRDTAEVGTGDLVERRGNRFEFTGRRGDVIVVGGAKVYPKRVEELLRSVPGVADARVHGMPSAITGELVAAEIVVSDPLPEPSTADQVRGAALAVCREKLEPHAVPRVLDIVKKLATTPAGKIPRR